MQTKYVLIGLVGILALTVWMNSNRKSVSVPVEGHHSTHLDEASSPQTLQAKQATGLSAAQEQALTAQERNFATLAKALLNFSDTKKSKEDFIAFLQSLGLAPIIAEDKQDLIEDLTIIRTRNSLPGVRYIHAQYDGDEKQTLQHFSFEIPKNEHTLDGAVNFIKKVLPLGERVANTDPRMAVFKLPHYVLYLKELTPEDMLGDPFNAYEPSDAGNIRVVIERDIHEHHTH